MGHSKVDFNLTFKLGETQKEKLNLKGESVVFKMNLPIDVQCDGDVVYYLNEESFNKEDFDLFSAKPEYAKVFDENNNEIVKNKDKLFSEFSESIILLVNAEVESGVHDQQIKNKYKKSGKVKVTLADINSKKHRASPNNEKRDHNWNGTGPIDEEAEKIPSFRVTNANTGEEIGQYDNIRNVCIALGGLSTGNVRLCLREKRATCEGYSFSFIDHSAPEVVTWLQNAEIQASGGY